MSSTTRGSSLPWKGAIVFTVIYSILLACCQITSVSGDAWNPVKYPDEESFWRAKTHERSMTVKEMEDKINVIRKRRGYRPWDESNPIVSSTLKQYSNSTVRRPNILFVLTDDLGYGDLSVEPFVQPFEESKFPCTEGGILTPQLERMAKNGVILTNYHASAPVCSPARASIMTGLYPWRMTAMNAFELGRDPMQRNNFLPQIPTIAEMLRQAGYYTVHSGKWHLGGMREELRRDRAYHDRCSRPSPNQHGFEEYISELDGPESPRYTFFLRHNCLHTKGHRHLLKDDVPVPIIEKPHEENVLSDREAEDAIYYMEQMKKHHPNQPWFIQVWFNAPHGPWELLQSGEDYYSKKYKKDHNHWANYMCTEHDGRKASLYTGSDKRWYYKTMVSAMDKSMGKLLDAVRDLGIEKDTLIVFTSDNGPEMGAGTGGVFREGKRSLMEGGVRVPMIMQWKGVIPENTYTHYFAGHTDLVPTFLHAAHVPKPEGMNFDGISILPVLTKATPITEKGEVNHHIHHVSKHVPGEKEIRARYFHFNLSSHRQELVLTNSAASTPLYHVTGILHHDENSQEPIDRVFLWHKDTDPFSRDERVQSAGYYDYVKVIASTQRGCIDRIFDMRHDPLEHVNLLTGSDRPLSNGCRVNYNNIDFQMVKNLLANAPLKPHCSVVNSSNGGKDRDTTHNRAAEDECKRKYNSLIATKVWIILKKLIPFVKYGNRGHLNYLSKDADHATCMIPVTNDVFKLNYNVAQECKGDKFGCSEPEY